MWLLAESLRSEQGFAQVQTWLALPMMKLLLWAILSALLYHIIAGLRHLLMDIGIGETLEGGRRGAILILVFSAVAIVLAGVWIW